MRILVSAAGGDFGQALIKALRLSAEPMVIYGCDLDADGIGPAFVDGFQVVPAADDDGYVDRLDELCRAWEVDAVVPGSEQEIAVLSRLKEPKILASGAVVISQPGPWIEAYGDKLKCMNALEDSVELGLYADGTDKVAVKDLLNEVEFPVVTKSRKSSGSKTLRIVSNQAELQTSLAEIELPLVQQYLDGDEFSAGVFVGKQFSAAIVFKRILGAAGCSWYAETSDDPDVLEYVQGVASVSEQRGSANIQVRKTKAGVRLLEINPRFSSLVAARAFCGFHDAEWAVREALGLEVNAPEHEYKRIRFRRYFHEMIDSGDGFHGVSKWQPKSL